MISPMYAWFPLNFTITQLQFSYFPSEETEVKQPAQSHPVGLLVGVRTRSDSKDPIFSSLRDTVCVRYKTGVRVKSNRG